MARSKRLFVHHRGHGGSGVLSVILPRIVAVVLLCLALYYLLHKTSQHLNKL
ncbi:MAG TPA: hypothetical protein VH540_26685 [Ktedonobacterales bacterium]|jgi:hypothetical protein